MIFVVGCGKKEEDRTTPIVDDEEDRIINVSNEAKNEKEMMEYIIAESEKVKSYLLKGADHQEIHGYFLQNYDYEGATRRKDEDGLVFLTIKVGREYRMLLENAEKYKLNGIDGYVGNDDSGNFKFEGEVGGVLLEIKLTDVESEKGKTILDGIELGSESLTEQGIKESLGIDYEEIKYLDTDKTGYEFSSLKFNLNPEYRNLILSYTDTENSIVYNIYIEKEFKTGYDVKELHETETGRELSVEEGVTGRTVYYWHNDGYTYEILQLSLGSDVDEEEQLNQVSGLVDNLTRNYGE